MTTEENYSEEVVEIINPEELEPTGPKGIGGWLIFVLISYFLSAINIFRAIIGLIPALQYSETGPPLFRLVIDFEFIINIGMFGYVIFLLIMFFRLDRSFPKFASAFYLINLSIAVIDAFLVSFMIGGLHGASFAPIGQAVIGVLIWFNYFRVSVRVRNTFGCNGVLGR